MLAVVVLRLFSKRLSQKLWRALRWPFSLRLTTTKRQRARAAELKQERTRAQEFHAFYNKLGDALGIVAISGDQQLLDRIAQIRDTADTNARRFQEVCDLLGVRPLLADSTVVVERIQRLQEASAEAWSHAQGQIEATKSLAVHEAAEIERAHQLALEQATEAGRAQGRAAAESDAEAKRAVPLLRPVWRIDPVGTADAFVLKNTQHGVEISNVSVDASTGDFQFAGATQMRGGFDGRFEFYGQKTEYGRRLGVDFSVKWQDAHGEWWGQVVRVPAEPRRMTVL